MDPINEMNTATRIHFFPVVVNQIWKDSPILARIFKIAKEGKFGLALPSFDGRSIAEPLEVGEVGQEAVEVIGTKLTVANGATTCTIAEDPDMPAEIANRGFVEILDNDESKTIYAIASRTSATVFELTSVYEGTGSTAKAYKLTYYKDTVNAGGSYGKNTSWEAGTGEILAAANFEWKMYHETLKIHNLDSEINKGRERLLDITALKMRSSSRGLRRTLINDFYSNQADGGLGMVGLRAITALTGLVGGIQKRKYGYWQGVQEAKNAALDWDVLNKVWHTTKRYGNGDAPTLFVCSEGALQKYEEGLTKTVVTGNAGTRYPNIYMSLAADRARKDFDYGFSGFSFKEIPMIADPLMPVAVNSGFFLNENYLHYRILKAFESTGWQQLRSQGKDWAQLTIFGYGALTSSCCRKFGEITGLTEA